MDILKRILTSKNFLLLNGLFLMVFAIYGLTHGHKESSNYFTLLADSFLHGRFYVLEHPSWLNELVLWNGHYYVVYPPMPAIIQMPFVAIFGDGFYQPILSWILSGLNVGLCFLIVDKVFKNKQLSFWSSILLGFGSMQWFHGSVGSAWYFAHIVAMFFILLLLLEAVTKKRMFIMGLLIGCAYLARLPAILSVVFVIVLLCQNKLSVNIKNLIYLSLGLLPALVFNASYNYFRFGVVYDVAYFLLPIFDEPWYKNGLFSIFNIPIHLKELFTALPKIQGTPPFFIPSINVLAIWVVTPAFLLIPFANYKNRFVLASLFAVIATSIPGLMHGSNGFSQFGFRFALDYTPFLVMIFAGAFQRFKSIAITLVIFSMLINLWGVVMIRLLETWIW